MVDATMPHVGAEGVPSLRVLLARARRAGALVEDHAGEVRVTVGAERTNVSATRKDGTPELLRLVRKAEAVAPKSKPKPASAPSTRPTGPAGAPVPAVRSKAERIRSFLREQATDADGWMAFDRNAIADSLGVDANDANMTVVNGEASGVFDVRRDGRRIAAIRFRDATAPRPPSLRTIAREQTAERTAGQLPLPVASAPPAADDDVPRSPIAVAVDPAGILATPTLAAYAAARKAVRDIPMAKVEPTDAEVAEILREAVRLYWWTRASVERP